MNYSHTENATGITQNAIMLESARHNAWHTYPKFPLILSFTHAFIQINSGLRINCIIMRMASAIFYQQIWSFDKDFGNGEWRR